MICTRGELATQRPIGQKFEKALKLDFHRPQSGNPNYYAKTIVSNFDIKYDAWTVFLLLYYTDIKRNGMSILKFNYFKKSKYNIEY